MGDWPGKRICLSALRERRGRHREARAHRSVARGSSRFRLSLGVLSGAPGPPGGGHFGSEHWTMWMSTSRRCALQPRRTTHGSEWMSRSGIRRLSRWMSANGRRSRSSHWTSCSAKNVKAYPVVSRGRPELVTDRTTPRPAAFPRSVEGLGIWNRVVSHAERCGRTEGSSR
jgi:hypothetical protein